ncbi:hypothetical protein BH23PLA1_BH23PLA1_09330 [soil metagenome]
MCKQPEIWGRILETLAQGPASGRSPAELAERMGLGVEETTDALADMDVAGLIAVWEPDEIPSVTLSPLAAERLGVQMVEYGAEQVIHWAAAGDPVPAPPRAKNVCSRIQAANLDFLIDPNPTAEQAAEDSEEANARPIGDKAEPQLPFPTLLIGTGLTPWPGPDDAAPACCPACGARRLPTHAYCLCCDRWGLDGSQRAKSPVEPRRLPRPQRKRATSPNEPDRPQAQKHPEHPERLQRARRKARQKARLASRLEAKRSDQDPRTQKTGAGPPGAVPSARPSSAQVGIIPLHLPPRSAPTARDRS